MRLITDDGCLKELTSFHGDVDPVNIFFDLIDVLFGDQASDDASNLFI